MSLREAWLSAGLALACAGPAEQPSPVAACPESDGVVTRVDAALEIGLGQSDVFEPIFQGQTLAIVQGTQGGFMVTPNVRADLDALGGDGRCVAFGITAAVDGHSDVHQSYRFTQPDTLEHFAFTDTVPLLLSFDPLALDGKTCVLEATWRDDDREAAASVSVALAYEP